MSLEKRQPGAGHLTQEVSEADVLRAQIAAQRRRRDRAVAAEGLLRKRLEEARTSQPAAPGSRVAGTAAGEASQPPPAVGQAVRIAEGCQLAGQEAVIVQVDDKKGRCKVRLETGEMRQVPTGRLLPLPKRDGQQRQVEKGSSAAAAAVESPALLSTRSLTLHSCLSDKAGGLPCELLPFVQSAVARVELPERLVRRLVAQVDLATRHPQALNHSQALHGEVKKGCQVRLEAPDKEYMSVLLQMCHMLAWGLLGHHDFACEVDSVWAVVQREGDYSAMKSQRNRISPAGFSSLLDIQLPPQLSSDNHDRPTKGAYGYHDGLHNLNWKADRTLDRNDCIHAGIIQLELVTGLLYVFPQWLRHLAWPFEGEGDRKWIAANIALNVGGAAGGP